MICPNCRTTMKPEPNAKTVLCTNCASEWQLTDSGYIRRLVERRQDVRRD